MREAPHQARVNTPEYPENKNPPAPGAGAFATTRWSLVLAAQHGDAPHAAPALEQLCRTYWYPIYAQARRSGYQPQDAEDLTQAFFARLLEKNWIASVDRERGRFRGFLATALQHFLANERDRARARKRGGGKQIVSLDAIVGEERWQQEPATDRTAEQEFDRRWALALLDQVLSRLEKEYANAGKSRLFERLKGTVGGETVETSGAEMARDLGLSDGAVRVAAHRLRQRYRELLREEIAHTVCSPEAVEEELRCLFAAFSR